MARKRHTKKGKKAASKLVPVARPRGNTFTLKATAVFVAVGVCVGIVISPHLPPEAKVWTITVLKALVAGIIKHLTSNALA